MGQITPPQLSWKLLLLGAALSSTSALGTAAMVLSLLGIEAAKKALLITSLIVLVILSAATFSKIMQRKSAQYYYIGGAFFSANLVAFLYFFLVPVFFTHPIWTFEGLLITFVMLLCIFLNAKMAQRHFVQSWAKKDADLVVSKNGKQGVSIRRFANSPDMSAAPNMFNFEPRWLSWILVASALGAMIFGLNFIKQFPGFSIFTIGCGVVYLGSYMSQWFVVAFYKVRIIRHLEKKHGHSLAAIDFSDRRTNS